VSAVLKESAPGTIGSIVKWPDAAQTYLLVVDDPFARCGRLSQFCRVACFAAALLPSFIAITMASPSSLILSPDAPRTFEKSRLEAPRTCVRGFLHL
jgi:hypothetical protein